MVDFFLESAEHFGYLGIMLALVLTGAGLPIPEELFVILAGVLASDRGHPWMGFGACMAGALMGDSVMYLLGYRFGHDLIRKHPRVASFLHAEREKQLETLIQRHGWKAFLVARFLVSFRCPMYLASGIMRVPLRKFFLWDSMCAAVVVGIFYWSSYFFGDEIIRWVKLLQSAEKAVTVLVIVAIAVAAIWWWRRLRGRAAETLSPRPGARPTERV